MLHKPKRDLTQLGRGYGDFIFAVFERLCADDGKTIATEDLKAFETWNANKVLALETQLRAEGLTESDISAWRAGSLLRDQCVLPDGRVTAHASARAAPRIRRHALPNDVSSE